MPIIYSTTKDGQAVKIDFGATWAATRDATSATHALTGGTRSRDACSALFVPKGGGLYVLNRAFFAFDTSGITVDPASASIFLKTANSTGADFFCLDHTARPLSWGVDDWDTMTGWNTGSADGSGAGDNESTVKKLSAEITSVASDGSYTEIPLNATASEVIASEDLFSVAMIESVHDLRDIAPTDLSAQTGFYFADYSGTSSDPYLSYVAGGAAVTDNATFFGANF